MTKQKLSEQVQASVSNNAQKFGNKAANLQELASVCPYNVPAFCPLSDDLVKAHLNTYAPNWTHLWNAFQVAQAGERSDLTEEAKQILKSLRELIDNAFNDNPIDDPALINYLDKIKRQKATLMVRSTGEEDTVDVANPGGNESIAAVVPEITAVSKAMGQVVASYFSEKSLKQRLLSPKNDITQSAFMPVLVQKMIGEPLNGFKDEGRIIRSGVMYTDEGITRIQVAPGHGELIVNSKGSFDTFSVTREDMVYTEITHKSFRLVPTRDGLKLTPNPPKLQVSSSISQDVALRIAQLGRKIEAH